MNQESVYVVIWTTTPWSLVGNQAVAVNEKLKYVLAKSKLTNDTYIIAENLLKNLEQLPSFAGSSWEIIGTNLGQFVSNND